MESIAVSSTIKEIRTQSLEGSYRRTYRRWITVLLISSIVASITGTFGLALALASLLHIISSRSRLGIAGAILLSATFPFMVLAAHSLDRADEVKRSYRLAVYKRRVFGDYDRETE